jgi:hypothetical protein
VQWWCVLRVLGCVVDQHLQNFTDRTEHPKLAGLVGLDLLERKQVEEVVEGRNLLLFKLVAVLLRFLLGLLGVTLRQC